MNKKGGGSIVAKSIEEFDKIFEEERKRYIERDRDIFPYDIDDNNQAEKLIQLGKIFKMIRDNYDEKIAPRFIKKYGHITIGDELSIDKLPNKELTYIIYNDIYSLYQYHMYIHLIEKQDFEFRRIPEQYIEKYKEYDQKRDHLFRKYLDFQLILVTNPIIENTVRLSESLGKQNNRIPAINDSKYKIEFYKIIREKNPYYDSRFDDIPLLSNELIDELSTLSKKLKEKDELYVPIRRDFKNMTEFDVKLAYSFIICKLMILLRNEDNKIIGFSRLAIVKNKDHEKNYHAENITISILPEFRGKRLCTTFVSKIYNILLDEIKLGSVLLSVRSENPYRACYCYLKAALNKYHITIEIPEFVPKVTAQIKNESDMKKFCDTKGNLRFKIIVTKDGEE